MQASQWDVLNIHLWPHPCRYLTVYHEFNRILEEVKQEGEHVFPGTIARYIIWSKTHPGMLEILLIWRSTTTPGEADREEALERFRRALADVLDWKIARYDEGQILLHT